MRNLVFVFAIAVTACVSHDATSSSESAISGEDLFTKKVFPMLDATCGACHGIDSSTVPDISHFMIPDDPHGTYELITTDPSIVGDFDANAPILTKGVHEGPTFTVNDASVLLDWLTAEHADRY